MRLLRGKETILTLQINAPMKTHMLRPNQHTYGHIGTHTSTHWEKEKQDDEKPIKQKKTNSNYMMESREIHIVPLINH